MQNIKNSLYLKPFHFEQSKKKEKIMVDFNHVDKGTYFYDVIDFYNKNYKGNYTIILHMELLRNLKIHMNCLQEKSQIGIFYLTINAFLRK